MTKRRHIQHYRTNTRGKRPLSKDLKHGEIAINFVRGEEKMFIKNTSNEIVDFISKDGVKELTKQIDLGEYKSDTLQFTARTTEPDAEYCFNYNNESVTAKDKETIILPATDTLYSMFRDCRDLTSINLSKSDASNVKDMSSMFEGCINLESIEISNWDTSKVKSMSGMFYDCSSLEYLDISEWETPELMNVSEMFCKCTNLKWLDISNFDAVNDLDDGTMFVGCHSLRYIEVSEKFFNGNYVYLGYVINLGIGIDGSDNGWLEQISSIIPSTTYRRVITLHENLKNKPWAAPYISIIQSKGWTVA